MMNENVALDIFSNDFPAVEGGKNVFTLSFQEYLDNWDKNYRAAVEKLPVFNNPKVVAEWPLARKKFFVKLLYHARGHFSDFLWYMGNVAPSKKEKDLVLHNFSEEFGGHAPSHEQLYFYFAKELGVSPEILMSDDFYLGFLKEFNKGHLDWLRSNGWEGCLAAYSAYERLDNLDYKNLLTIAQNMKLTTKGLVFFKVHYEAEHFDVTESAINAIWETHKPQVIASFDFIANHQIAMWTKFAEYLLES